MGKIKGPASKHGLADMATYPEPWRYERPQGGDETEFPVELDGGHRFVHRFYVYRALIVDFAITHLYEHAGEVATIARIDCCHGEVHRHVFDRRGGELSRSVIQVIPERDPWKTIDELYLQCDDQMHAAWLEHYRSWERS